MIKIATKHILTGAELTQAEIYQLILLAVALKQDRKKSVFTSALQHQHLALLFDKPSLRTRMSFIVAMQELGGQVVESVGQSRKEETPEDQIRVIQGYCHGLMIRTYRDSDIERMAALSSIPIINALSDLYHPCQTLADLMTLREVFNTLEGLQICYIGDGNNILHSLLLMAPKMGIKVNYCCPPGCEPLAFILQQARKQSNKIEAFSDPQEAVRHADAVYTDVWTSMGFSKKDEIVFQPYQVTKALMQKANSGAVFMHCMPIDRGKECSATLPDDPCSVIFQQSENRLHVQKALLLGLLGE